MFALKAQLQAAQSYPTSEVIQQGWKLAPQSSSSPHVPRLSLNVETTWLDLSLSLTSPCTVILLIRGLSKHVELNYNQLFKGNFKIYLILLTLSTILVEYRRADFWYLKNFCYLMGDEGESYCL